MRFTCVLVTCACAIACVRQAAGQTVVDADRLLGEYETVFAGTADVVSGNLVKQADRANRMLRVPFGPLLFAFDTLGPSARAHFDRSVDEVAMGARNFRPPRGLGSVQFDFCYIVRLRQRTLSIGEWLQEGGVTSDAVRVAREGVLTWALPPQEGRRLPLPVYATIINGKLLVTSSLDQIDATTRPLTVAPRSLDARLANVRRSAFWGYRVAGANIPSGDALGTGSVAVVGYDAANRAISLNVSGVVAPEIRFRSKEQLGQEKLRATVTLSDDNADLQELFYLFLIMGFGVNL
jgi:hypothetical protein